MADITKRLWTALQPIIDLETGEVVAHEALLRGPQGTSWETPAALFAIADRLGQRTTLEIHARRLALGRLKDLPTDQQLFMNVDMSNPDMPALPGYADVRPDRVILEISEQQPILDNPQLLEQIRHWRAAGHRIAMDDYGTGYMGIGAMLSINPDFIKLDRLVIAGVEHDPKRQAIMQSITRMSPILNAIIIAEGLETPDEIACVRDAGIRYGQGFGLGRPQRNPAAHHDVYQLFRSTESRRHIKPMAEIPVFSPSSAPMPDDATVASIRSDDY